MVLVSDLGRHEVVCFRSIEDDTVVNTLGTGRGDDLAFSVPYGLVVLDGSYCPPVCICNLPVHSVSAYQFSDFLPASCLWAFHQGGPVVVVVDYAEDWLDLRWLGNGIVWKRLGSRGNEPGQFTCPWAVATTRAGALVVTDWKRVQVLTVDGAVLCVLDPTVLGFNSLGRTLHGAHQRDLHHGNIPSTGWWRSCGRLPPMCVMMQHLHLNTPSGQLFMLS
jgi:hypothetical protein